MEMKNFKIVVVSLVIALILYSPFLMPNNWIYVIKGIPNVYDRTWCILALIGKSVLAWFAGVGIVTTVKSFLK